MSNTITKLLLQVTELTEDYRENGRSRNFERLKGGRQCVSLVVIYRKCTHELYAFYTEKDGLLKKIPSQLNPPLKRNSNKMSI